MAANFPLHPRNIPRFNIQFVSGAKLGGEWEYFLVYSMMLYLVHQMSHINVALKLLLLISLKDLFLGLQKSIWFMTSNDATDGFVHLMKYNLDAEFESPSV